MNAHTALAPTPAPVSGAALTPPAADRKWTTSRFAGVLLLLVCLGWVTGCKQVDPGWTSAPGPSVAPTNAALGAVPAMPVSPATQLAEGDVIQVAFDVETNLNATAKIQLDGSVVLPLLGSRPAAGKTLSALQADLQTDYGRLVKNSELRVTLVSSVACVYVSGAVLKPGRIPMDRPLTAMEAIMEAGGFDLTRAKPSNVSVLRIENGQQKHYRVNLKSALQEGDTQPFQLQPFDIVYVPVKTFNF
jgi:polysaccharide export outer membrane protein